MDAPGQPFESACCTLCTQALLPPPTFSFSHAHTHARTHLDRPYDSACCTMCTPSLPPPPTLPPILPPSHAHTWTDPAIAPAAQKSAASGRAHWGGRCWAERRPAEEQPTAGKRERGGRGGREVNRGARESVRVYKDVSRRHVAGGGGGGGRGGRGGG